MPRSKTRSQNLPSPQLDKTFYKFHGTQRFIVRSKRFDRGTLQGTLIQFILSHLNYSIDNHYKYNYGMII